MISDPGQGDIASQAEQNRLRAINSGNPDALRAAGIIPAMADKTTTTKSSAALDVPDVTTTVIKEKVPTGSAQWGNVQHPPNWQQRFDRRPVTFSSPMQPEGALFAQDIIDYTPPTEAELFGPPDAASFTGPAYNRHPPNWMMRTGTMGEGYFGDRIPSPRPASPASEDDIIEMLRVLKGMEGRRGY